MARCRSSPLLLLAAAFALVVAALLQPAHGFLLPTPSRITGSWQQQQHLQSRSRTPVAATNALSPNGEYDLELFSPAKVNLFLRIIRRREDGYHELASLFQTVGFGDTLLFKASLWRGVDASMHRMDAKSTTPRAYFHHRHTPSTTHTRSSPPARPPTNSAPPSPRS